MSATKNYLLDCLDNQEQADLDLYAAGVSLAALADRAWAGGDVATWAPDAEWLASTQRQLRMMQQALAELDTARGCLDYTDPVPATV